MIDLKNVNITLKNNNRPLIDDFNFTLNDYFIRRRKNKITVSQNST
ncbi:hypothetical protein [Natronospora cellulosivora (SeqCode)]